MKDQNNSWKREGGCKNNTQTTFKRHDKPLKFTTKTWSTKRGEYSLRSIVKTKDLFILKITKNMILNKKEYWRTSYYKCNVQATWSLHIRNRKSNVLGNLYVVDTWKPDHIYTTLQQDELMKNWTYMQIVLQKCR